jgi:hypothetical protein
MSMVFHFVSNMCMSWFNYHSIPWLNANLAPVENCSGPLRFRLRLALLHSVSSNVLRNRDPWRWPWSVKFDVEALVGTVTSFETPFPSNSGRSATHGCYVRINVAKENLRRFFTFFKLFHVRVSNRFQDTLISYHFFCYNSSVPLSLTQDKIQWKTSVNIFIKIRVV